MDTSIRNWYKK